MRLRQHVTYLRRRADVFETRARGHPDSPKPEPEPDAKLEPEPEPEPDASGGRQERAVVETHKEAEELEDVELDEAAAGGAGAKQREASEEVEARLQRLLDMLRGLCPELDRLAPGAGRATLSPQFDSVGELAAAIDRGFWSLVAGRAAVQRRLLRAVRLSAEERRGHEAERATLKAQHEAALHAATQSASQERLNLEMEKADSAGLRHQLEEKVRFLEAEGQLLRESEERTRQESEAAKEATVAGYERSLAPLKSALRAAKTELGALGQRERLLCRLAEQQREALAITERMGGMEDYEQLLVLNRQRAELGAEIERLTRQLTAVPVGQTSPESARLGGPAGVDVGDSLIVTDEGAVGAESGGGLLRARHEEASRQAASAQAELLLERERGRGVSQRLAVAEGAAAAAEARVGALTEELERCRQEMQGQGPRSAARQVRAERAEQRGDARDQPAADANGPTAEDVAASARASRDLAAWADSGSGSESSYEGSATGEGRRIDDDEESYSSSSVGDDGSGSSEIAARERIVWGAEPGVAAGRSYDSLQTRLEAAGWGAAAARPVPSAATTTAEGPVALPGAPPLPPGPPPGQQLPSLPEAMPPPPQPSVLKFSVPDSSAEGSELMDPLQLLSMLSADTVRR